MKKFFLVMFVAMISFVLISCNETGNETQGITDEYIIIGNTAATSGAFAGVGVPFNLAMQVVFDEYNETHDGRDIKFLHYDDGFDIVPGTGLALTKKLVEEDKVFALVGHFGTNTVNATMDYLLETGVPMVYGVTGVNSLYFEDVPGNNILSVQPIYKTEGKMMVARALHESLFGPELDSKISANGKILVLYSDDDAGQSIRLGINEQLAVEGVDASRIITIPFSASTASAVIPVGLAQNPEVILLSSNQAPATAAATALRVAGSNIPVLSSYVNAAGVFTPAQASGQPLPFPVYANAWVDIASALAPAPTPAQIGQDGELVGYTDLAVWEEMTNEQILATLPGFTAEYWEDFVQLLNNSDRTDGETTARALWANAYAMAGFVAAKTFVALLEKVEDFDTLTWESFIALAEEGPIDLPLAGTIDWSNGQRVGLDSLSLNKLTYPATGATFVKVREVESLTVVSQK